MYRDIMSIIDRIKPVHLATIASLAVVAIGAVLIGIATTGAAVPFMLAGVLLVSCGGSVTLMGCFCRRRNSQ
jgi:hypothetical protein